MSMVVPRPIGWLGTRSKAGAPNLAPFSYFNGLSASAMPVGASIGRRSEREAEREEAWRRDHGGRSRGEPSDRERTGGRSEDRPYLAGGILHDATDMDGPSEESPRRARATLRPPRQGFADGGFPDAGDRRRARRPPREVRGVRLDPSLDVDVSSLHVAVASLRPVGRLGLDEYTLLGEVRRVARPRIS